MDKRKLLHNQFIGLSALYRLRDGLEDIGITINSGVGTVGESDAGLNAVFTGSIYQIIDADLLPEAGFSPDDVDEAIVRICEAYSISESKGKNLEKLFWNCLVEHNENCKDEFLERIWNR